MTQIARRDWLPERARWSHLARSGLPAVSRKENFPKSHVMHLSMSCPNGGSAGIYGLLTRKRCPCQGKFDFFYQGIPEGRDYWHPWSSWTGPVINLSSHAPKRGRKTNIEPRIKLNHNIYKQMKHITVLWLLKLKMIFKWKWSLFKFMFASVSSSFNDTVWPLLSGHPPLSGHFPNSLFFCQ